MSTDPSIHHWPATRISAQEFARDYVCTARVFADAFVQAVTPDSTQYTAHELQRRRRETCAALWAAIVATFEAAPLTDQEKARVVPIIRQEMMAAWNKHCAGDPAFLCEIMERSNFYLRSNDRASQLTTATDIVRDLVASIGENAALTLPTKRLAALIAHRMLEDLQRINTIKARSLIE